MSHIPPADDNGSTEPAGAGKLVSNDNVNQFALLKQRRFLPFFLTQLLGAFNDNVYKNALVALITFAVVRESALSDSTLINLAAGLFILPFFLFSAFSGQVSDKYEKSSLVQKIKLCEIIIMMVAIVALHLNSLFLLLVVLFLMGMQSTFFGPVKYAILPQHLNESELTGGNGLVEMGTFLAILLGTIAGTQLIARFDEYQNLVVSAVLVSVAIAGYITSRNIPVSPAGDPSLKLQFNPLLQTLKLVRETSSNRVILQSILAISWFWFMGATYIAQFPVYARDTLGGNVDVFTLMLGVFSVGIGLGSALCERLSHKRVEIGLVPFGAIGLTLFGLDLVIATPNAPLGETLSILQMLGMPGTIRVLLDIFMIGLFGGFYIVPLYALIQQRSEPERLSRTIACNNILNALFMTLSAVIAGTLLSLGFSIQQLFLAMAVANAMVALYIFRQVPEFFMRFLIWLLIHTSFVDALILGGCIRRPVRFVMYYKIYEVPGLHFIFRTAGAIPIASQKENKILYDQAFNSMREALDNGELLCLFPEGQITHDGQMNELRPGILRVLENKPVPVIPVALSGLWGSLFSRKGGRAFFKLPRRLFARIDVRVGVPMEASQISLKLLHRTIEQLRGSRL